MMQVILVENKVELVKNLAVHAKALYRFEQKLRAKGILLSYNNKCKDRLSCNENSSEGR